jgi:hypothetical protein
MVPENSCASGAPAHYCVLTITRVIASCRLLRNASANFPSRCQGDRVAPRHVPTHTGGS